MQKEVIKFLFAVLICVAGSGCKPREGKISSKNLEAWQGAYDKLQSDPKVQADTVLLNQLSGLKPSCSENKKSLAECNTHFVAGWTGPHCYLPKLNLSDKAIYKYTVSPDASFTRIKIKSLQDLSENDLESVDKNNGPQWGVVQYYSCVANWLAGERSETKSISNGASLKPAFGSESLSLRSLMKSGKVATPGVLRSECLEAASALIQTNTVSLRSEFSSDASVVAWIKNFNERVNLCAQVIRKTCVNVSNDDGKYFISYLGKDKKLKKITQDDSDISEIKINGSDAKKIISSCASLEKAGFSWVYGQPIKE